MARGVMRITPRAALSRSSTFSPPTEVGLGAVNAPASSTSASGTTTSGTTYSTRGVDHSAW